MRRVGRSSGLLLWVACSLLMPSGAARSADLYLSGTLSLSAGVGDTSGGGSLGPLPTDSFRNTGSDVDSSPVLGGTFGYAFPLSEMFPRNWDWSLPDWTLRWELEGLALRDYELVTGLNVGGVSAADDYFTEVSNWALLHNWWLDLPVHAPLALAFGRIPILEPMTMHLGGGVGVGFTDLKTSSAAFKGSDDVIGLTWQVGAGFDYQITDRVSVGAGYRYVDVGSFKYPLRIGDTRVGSFRADLVSHELRSGIRVNFYSVASPGSWERPSFQRGR